MSSPLHSLSVIELAKWIDTTRNANARFAFPSGLSSPNELEFEHYSFLELSKELARRMIASNGSIPEPRAIKHGTVCKVQKKKAKTLVTVEVTLEKCTDMTLAESCVLFLGEER